MTETEYNGVLLEERLKNANYEHQCIMDTLVTTNEYNLFSILKPKLTKDGDQWCVLYGTNIQEGVVGFGDTPYLAILDWDKAWNKNK